MKRMKKVFALLLTMVMVLAMAVPAMAASITITPNGDTGTNNTTYTYYEVFKADIKDANHTAYYIPATSSTLKTAVESTNLFTLTLSADGSRYNVELKDASTSAETIAAQLAKYVTAENALTSNTFQMQAATETETAKAKADGLDAGYYLIRSSAGKNLAVQTLGSVEIKDKASYPTSEKTDNIDDDTVFIGTTVPYTIKVKIPAEVESYDITVVDIISKGLTMNTSIAVTGVVEGSELTELTWVEDTTYSSTEGTKKYTTVINKEDVVANAGKTLVLSYTAKVNDSIEVNVDASNKAYIEYDNSSSVTTGTTVKTHAFTLKKIDGANVTEEMTDTDKFALTALDGAEFTLWTAETGGQQIFVKATTTDGVYRVDYTATSGVNIEAGVATIEGLSNGTYYLQEEVAPTGYNRLTERKAIKVSATTSAEGVDIAIENNSGAELPSTGGIGTTIFYVIGAICVLGAGVLLVTRRRMSSK